MTETFDGGTDATPVALGMRDDADMTVREMMTFLEHALHTAVQPYLYEMPAWHDYFQSVTDEELVETISDEPIQLSFSFMYENLEPNPAEPVAEPTDLMAITRAISNRE